MNSNLWIALATVSFYELTIIQLGKEMNINATVVFLFFSSLLVYNLFRILGKKQGDDLWYSNFSIFSKWIAAFSFVMVVSSLFVIKREIWLFFILSGLLTFFYATPFFKIGKNDFNLRKYWFLKSIIVGLVWSISTSVIPIFESDFPWQTNFWYSLEKFLFIIGITIPYDIKDLEEDVQEKGMNTIVMKFGIKRTKIISNTFLFLGLLLALILYKELYIPITIVYLLAMVLNYKLDENKNDYWYTFLIDACIILYFLLVCVLSL